MKKKLLSTACALLALSLNLPLSLAQEVPFVVPATGVKLTAQQTEALSSIKKSASTQEATVVRLNTDALRNGDRISIPLDTKSVAIQNNSRRESNGSTTIFWFGSAPNEVSGSTAIVVNDRSVTGSIQTVDGLYRIRPLGDGLHALVKVDTRKLPQEHPIN